MDFLLLLLFFKHHSLLLCSAFVLTASTTTIHDNSNGDIDDLKLDGRSLLDEAVVEESGSQTQHSCKELTSNLDDMQSDVQIFKQALIQMQSCLEQEEEEKEK